MGTGSELEEFDCYDVDLKRRGLSQEQYDEVAMSVKSLVENGYQRKTIAKPEVAKPEADDPVNWSTDRVARWPLRNPHITSPTLEQHFSAYCREKGIVGYALEQASRLTKDDFFPDFWTFGRLALITDRDEK